MSVCVCVCVNVCVCMCVRKNGSQDCQESRRHMRIMNGQTCRGGENDLGLETAEGGQPEREMGSGSATIGIRASCPPFRSLTLTVAPSLRARHLP
jgi:hypothetical protein